MSLSDTESDDLPTKEVCEKLCEEFAQVTGTDTALAMFYLQDRSWDLQRSLNAYFEESIGGADTNEASGPSSKSDASSEKTPDLELKEAEKKVQEADPQPKRIRIMSWNIDGLDTNNIKNRAKGVCTAINKEQPDVVYLQEVTPGNVDIIETGCPNYQLIPAGGEGYFVAIMLRLPTVQYEDSAITPFFTSKMGRNLLQVKAEVKKVPFLLMTSHLESTKSHAAERKRQLQMVFKEIGKSDAERTVIFGGDLNMRDKELEEVGGLPDNVVDLWEVTGKRPEAKFTWDLTKNDNLDWHAQFRPKCRFDRLFMKRASNEGIKLKPVYFELAGLERLQSCKRFCSDHWAILSHFDKL